VIHFDDTSIAFKSKTNRSLKKAYWLFKLIGIPVLVKIGKPVMNFSLRIKLPIKGLIKASIFDQFCGGETVNECSDTIDHLGKDGIGTILDYSIEGKTEDVDFDNTVQEIIKTIEKGAHDKNIPFAVFKVTGISRINELLLLSEDITNGTNENQSLSAPIEARILQICQAAYTHQVPVFIDAEESWIQPILDKWCFEMMLQFNKQKAIVYNTLQMYRHDRFAFLKEALNIAKEYQIIYGIKLVRGAYMEKERERASKMNYPSPIQANKEATDHDFNAALDFIIENLKDFALVAGTHNEESSAYLAAKITEKGLDQKDDKLFFAQLLGMSDHISYNLSNAGFRVAKYVPYGPIEEVMPYLLRRADENTSVAGQTSRELRLIQIECKRRGI
jgi:proline dehydrogenase